MVFLECKGCFRGGNGDWKPETETGDRKNPGTQELFDNLVQQ
jgi:hypothetical protein